MQTDRVSRRPRSPIIPATTIFAVGAAITAFVVAQTVGVRYPAQLVTSAAAVGAWIGFLWRGRNRNELLTLRLLLAANLYVLAFATGQTAGATAVAVSLATALAVGATLVHLRRG